MTKHDPAEIEAVASQIQSAYAFIFDTEIAPRQPNDAWAAIATAAVGMLNAYRASAIRAAVGELEAAAFDRGCFAIENTGVNMDAVNRNCVRARAALLAICGIDEQENA